MPEKINEKNEIMLKMNASLKNYNDVFLKCHGLDCYCIRLHKMKFISSIIFYE